MDVTTRDYSDSITILEVHGAIDGSSAPQLRDAITKVCTDGDLLLLDMQGVHFMSSAGLRVMLLLHRQLQQSDGRVVLVGLREPIYDAMEATGFLKYFETAEVSKKRKKYIRAFEGLKKEYSVFTHFYCGSYITEDDTKSLLDDLILFANSKFLKGK